VKKIFIQSEGQCFGPCSVEEAKSLLMGGWISLTCLGHYEGVNAWRPLSSFPEIAGKESTSEGDALLVSPAPEAARPKDPLPPRPKWIGPAVLVVFVAISAAAVYLWWQGKRAVTPAPAPLPASALRSNKSAPANEEIPRSGLVAQRPTNSEVNAVAKPSIRHVATQTISITRILPASSNAPAVNARSEQPRVIAVRDSRNAPFIQYDSVLIDKVHQRWMALLEQKEDVRGPRGRVTIEFHQNYLGQIPEVRVTQTEVGDALASLCQRAILEAGPFPPWPKELRPSVKQENRLARFTFVY
jgi:hypothetical protein